jgi:hypothetical protein
MAAVILGDAGILEVATFGDLPSDNTSDKKGRLCHVLSTDIVYRDNGTAWTIYSNYIALGTSGTTAAAGNDSRLSDARTPTAHATSHKVGGSDVVLLNELGLPSGDVSLNSHKLTNLLDPTSAQDAAPKSYVDLLIQGIRWKAPVKAASTANVSLTAPGATLDGVTLVSGDRILLKDQTTAADNGLYVWTGPSATLTRATDADTGSEISQAAVFVMEGTVAADKLYVNTVNGTIALGSTALTFVLFSSGSSGGTTLGWFVVTAAAYGATGDGSTDDTSAINLAIAALNGAGGGVLYFPHPSVYYKVTGALTAITVPVLVLGDGMGSYDVAVAGSEVRCTSATAVLFTINAKTAKFQNIFLHNTATTPTAGAGVLVDGSYIGQKVDFDSVHIFGFYDDLDVKVGAQWSLVNTFIVAPVRYGVRVRNTVNGDAGDWSIVNSNFYAQVRDATAALQIESSGGGKISNTKFNMGNDSHSFGDMVHAANPATATSILEFVNCSFENYTGDAIDITGPNWALINAIGCQFGQYLGNTSGRPIKINNVGYANIGFCIFIGSGTTTAAIDLTSVTHARIGLCNKDTNFTAMLTQASCTDVIDRSDGGAASTHHANHEVGGSDAFTGIMPASAFAPSGLTGATATTRYVGGTASAAPATGTFALGDFVITQAGSMYICTVAGTPGTWVQVSGGGGGGGMTNPMTTTGDIIVGGSAGTPTRLAKGTDYYVLTMDPTTHLPVWALATGGASAVLPAGARALISETTLGGDVPVYTVTPPTSGYRNLIIEIEGRADGGGDLRTTFNGDTGANYSPAYLYTSGVSVASGANAANQNYMDAIYLAPSGAPAGRIGFFEATIPNYRGSAYKNMLGRQTRWDSSVSKEQVVVTGGQWANTAAINTIELTAGTGNIKAGTIVRVYGITDAPQAVPVGTGVPTMNAAIAKYSKGSYVHTGAGFVAVQWATEDSDPQGIAHLGGASNNSIILDLAGTYILTFEAQKSGGSSTIVATLLNGVNLIGQQSTDEYGATRNSMTVIFQGAVGDILQGMVYDDAGGGAGTVASANVVLLRLPTASGAAGGALYEQTLTAVAASITIPIPAGFKDIELDIIVRGDDAAQNLNLYLQANGDTSSIYDWVSYGGNTAAWSPAATKDDSHVYLGWMPGAGAPANQASSLRVELPGYENTTFNKMIRSRTGLRHNNVVASNLFMGHSEGWYRSLSAITSITLTPAAGNFAAGTVVRVYARGGVIAAPVPPIIIMQAAYTTINTTFQNVPWTMEEFVGDGFTHSTVTNNHQITIRDAGLYRVEIEVEWTASGNDAIIEPKINGASTSWPFSGQFAARWIPSSISGQDWHGFTRHVYQFAAGDVFSVQHYADAGATRAVKLQLIITKIV